MSDHLQDHPTKYDEEQKQFWQNLHQVLEQFKADLEATNVELAQGLGISRQPLVTFMQTLGDRGLSIHRVHLVKLWDFLTSPSLLEHKKISKGAKQKRLQLRKEGADRLLEAAGFLPSARSNRSNREQQSQRIRAMLASLPDIGFANFNSLINDLEVAIRARAFPYTQQLPSEQTSNPNLLSIPDRIQALFSEPLKSEISSPIILGEIQRFLATASASGRFDLNDVELFELGSSILSDRHLKQSINPYIRVKVYQCQFTVLTFSLQHYLDDTETVLKKELKQSQLAVESQLYYDDSRTRFGEKYDFAESKSVDSPFIMEAKIICQFPEIDEEICWLYRSSATHIENTLTALAIGMGYCQHLELIESSTRSLSQQGYGLVKASVAFREVGAEAGTGEGGIYESTWVDRGTIKAIIQSSLNATSKWLSDKLERQENYKNYYIVCQAVAEIENALAQGRKLLNDYAFRQIKDSSANRYLGKRVLDKVQELQRDMLRDNPILQDCFGAYLKRQSCFANLTCARSAHVEGNLTQARKFLDEVERRLRGDSNIQQCLEIKILYEIEWMVHQFFSGDSTFLSTKQWQSSLVDRLSMLNQYIAQQNLRYGKYSGRFDFSTYLCASEIFGRIARLNLCFCDEDDYSILKESIQHSIRAAYCASKIGYRQRSAHWLVNASRIHSRLGDPEGLAKPLCEVASRIIRASLEPTYSGQYIDSIMAEVNLAYGEWYLLVEKDMPTAINYFLKSLRGAIYIGFARLIADGIYGMARASQNLSNYRISKSLKQALNVDRLQSDIFSLDEKQQGWNENSIAAHVIEFLNELDKTKDWNLVSEQFKQQAKWIWQRWFTETHPGEISSHPVVEKIDDYTYLARLKGQR
ncbi:MAG: hypothetical protein KME11_21980 [Timaviella obliquedivisa GSE-PSE-MK23-08B]|jgi:biotin operon repressor|nr:hypothetical protein [Timaviella obliquedivisa GSE-PSE-MK23-08B]